MGCPGSLGRLLWGGWPSDYARASCVARVAGVAWRVLCGVVWRGASGNKGVGAPWEFHDMSQGLRGSRSSMVDEMSSLVLASNTKEQNDGMLRTTNTPGPRATAWPQAQQLHQQVGHLAGICGLNLNRNEILSRVGMLMQINLAETPLFFLRLRF